MAKQFHSFKLGICAEPRVSHAVEAAVRNHAEDVRDRISGPAERDPGQDARAQTVHRPAEPPYRGQRRGRRLQGEAAGRPAEKAARRRHDEPPAPGHAPECDGRPAALHTVL